MKRNVINASVVIALGLMSTESSALWEGDDWWVGGRVKQGVSVMYDLEDQGNKRGPQNWLVELKGNWFPTNDITVIGDFWLRGDWLPKNGSSIVQAGPTSTNPADWFNTDAVPKQKLYGNARAGGFGQDADDESIHDDFNREVIRELSFKYRDPENRFAVKAGKFQRGWGQSDGLRLLDILHAQDFRDRYFLGETDEVRIPAWMATFDVNIKDTAVGKMFANIGMKNTALEFVIIPEVNHSLITLNNPFDGGQSGGIFGLPLPRLVDTQSGLGIPFFGARVIKEQTPDHFSLDKGEYAMRFVFETMGANVTLNGFYGWQDLPVAELKGGELIIGSNTHDRGAAIAAGGAVVPIDLATTLSAAQDLYVPWLVTVANGTPGTFPFAALSGGACADPVLGGAGVGCSFNLLFDMDYKRRQKVVGMSLTRDMHEYKLGPKNVAPVLRMEASFEFGKPFNKYDVVVPAGGVLAPFEGPLGVGDGVGDGAAGETRSFTDSMALAIRSNIVERDVLSTMVGFDYFLWIPGWDSQRSSIFTSFQFFNIHTFDHEGLFSAGFFPTEVNRDQQFTTFVWDMGLYNENLKLQGLFVADWNEDGYIYRQRLDFNFFGDSVRPRLEWVHITGDDFSIPIGVFHRSDYVEASVTIQF